MVISDFKTGETEVGEMVTASLTSESTVNCWLIAIDYPFIVRLKSRASPLEVSNSYIVQHMCSEVYLNGSHRVESSSLN